ncbi:MAG: hypothetical protein M1828_000823 [Chrysothrix sp. TS-e1954]|nr:MAG: hypothetical protein M1828_000823 [Chrysothrix sp. TS-e1954]
MTAMDTSMQLTDKDTQWLTSDDFFDQYVNADFFDLNDANDATAGSSSGSDEFASLFEFEEAEESGGSKSTCTASPRPTSGDSPSPPSYTDALLLLDKAVRPSSSLAASLSFDDQRVVTSQGCEDPATIATSSDLASAADYKVDPTPLPTLPGQRSASSQRHLDQRHIEDHEQFDQMTQPEFSRPGQTDIWAHRLEESAHAFDLPFHHQGTLSPPTSTPRTPYQEQAGISPQDLNNVHTSRRQFTYPNTASPLSASFPSQPQNTPMLSPNPEQSRQQSYLQQGTTASPLSPFLDSTFSSDTVHSPQIQASGRGISWDRSSVTWPQLQQPSDLDFASSHLDESQVQPWWPASSETSQPYASYGMRQAYQTSRGPSLSTEASFSDESYAANPAAFQMNGLMINCPSHADFDASPDCGDSSSLLYPAAAATKSSIRMQKRQNSAPVRVSGSRLHASDQRRHRSQPSRSPSPPESSSHHSRHSSSRVQTHHRRSKSGVSSHNSVATDPTTSSPQSASVGFVNYTPHDSKKILSSVAPSGSSKTKARREKEAADKRRRLSQAAARAVREAGGDIHALEREGLFV